MFSMAAIAAAGTAVYYVYKNFIKKPEEDDFDDDYVDDDLDFEEEELEEEEDREYVSLDLGQEEKATSDSSTTI